MTPCGSIIVSIWQNDVQNYVHKKVLNCVAANNASAAERIAEGTGKCLIQKCRKEMVNFLLFDGFSTTV